MKPTYEELAKTILGLSNDTDHVYKMLSAGETPIITIGQWGRLETARKVAQKALADIA